MGTIKVNKIEKRSGSTLELGGACTAVTLASGATQTGFGRTGTVDWCTTAKTSPFTAASGDGFFLNTACGAITVTLPSSPSAGDIVAFKDYNNTWDTNNVTVARNGSKINGQCACATLRTESQSVTLIYVDNTKGWQDIHDSTSDVTGESFVAATGGTVTTCGNFKIHTFTADGCFQVTNAGNEGGSNKVSYVVVAGGGGGGSENASTTSSGGGGAGGYREGRDSPKDSYTASPKADSDSGLPVSVQTYPITVGGGGPGAPSSSGQNGTNGVNSVFSTITSAGGGGGSGKPTTGSGNDGGSGGGAKQNNPLTPEPGGPGNGFGSGNVPPVAPPQGNPGGNSDVPGPSYAAGGGGGASAAGGAPTPTATGAGGDGVTSSITGSPVARGGGGGAGKVGVGSPTPLNDGPGGLGGGGSGQPGPGADPSAIGAANTGGGGGGAHGKPNPSVSCGGAGGSGVVIIRYKFQ